MKEGIHLPHRVMAQGEAGIAYIVIGLELHLVSPIQPLSTKTGWRRAVISMRKGLPTMAWGMMR